MGALSPIKAQKSAQRAATLAVVATGLLFLFIHFGCGKDAWPKINDFRRSRAPEQLAVSMPSMMAGRQRKHGPLGILTQLSKAYKHGGEAVPMFPSDWVAARVDGERHAPPPLRVAHIMMSNHYRIIYVKCTKTAGKSGPTCGGRLWLASLPCLAT